MPKIAADFNKGKVKDIKDYCFNFNVKITKGYEAESSTSNNLLNTNIDTIKNLNDYKNNLENISINTKNTLNITSIASSNWMEFYPAFSLKYKLRPNITNSELKELRKMRETFDKSFKFLAEMDIIVKNPMNQNTKFSEKINYYEENLKSIEFYFNSINDITKTYGKMVTILFVYQFPIFLTFIVLYFLFENP